MAQFEPIRALGLMTGTSMDGVDAGVLVTDGVEITEIGESAFRPFTPAETAVLEAAQGLRPEGDAARLAAASDIIQQAHAEVVGEFDDLDVVGFHGQTLAHDPIKGRTHQLGNGSVLAADTGQRVVWDFRSEDMQHGGQGAPLAPFYHFALARMLEMKEPVAFLNLGGVGNVTLVNPTLQRPEDPGALLAFDTGPANAPLNDLMKQRRGVLFDEDGALAAQGKVDEQVISRVYQREFFGLRPPKSLDRNDFTDALALVEGLSDADAAATLTALSAACVSQAQGFFDAPPQQWLVCGGGRSNPVLMRELSTRLDGKVCPIEDVGLDGDMLEAQAFAYLAVRVLRGLPTSAPGTTGCAQPVCGGRVS